MANLLPQEMKKDLRREYTRRLVIVSILSIIGVLFVSIVSLFPTYIVLTSNKKELVEFRNSLQVGEKSDAMAVVSEMEEDVTLLKKDTFSQNIPYGIFVNLFKIKTENIIITRISFSKKDNALFIKGVAATRRGLKDFIDSIGEEEMFLPIENFPYSDFSERENLPFDFSIKLADAYDK